MDECKPLPVGTPITAAHFVPGQYVDVTGYTIGKGFQGRARFFYYFYFYFYFQRSSSPRRFTW